MLKRGAGVVTSRYHVHYVVTEYGVADLYGRTIRERAEALINIAAPEYQDELTHEAKKLNYV
jgi:acetyl-CoA hydrolase